MAKNLYTRQAGKHQAAPNMAQPHRSLNASPKPLGRPSPLMALLTTLRGALTFLLLQGKSEADLIVCPGISITSYLSRRSFPCEDTFLLHSLLNSMLNEVLIL